MAAIYTVYTSPNHPPIPNHLPTLIVTPHGQPSNILYSYLHTNFNTENYLLTPSPQGDLCVAKLFPPRHNAPGKATASDPGHSGPSSSRIVRCEASRNLKWSITNTGVLTPIYKLALPSPNSADLPLFQISKPNPNATFWSMFYFAYAGHNIPPKRIEFGKIMKNPPGPNGGGTRISITGKTPEEKAVWQTLGEGNEDCVEWVVLCAALNLLDDEIVKAAEKNPPPPSSPGPANSQPPAGPGGRPAPVALRDPGPTPVGTATPPTRSATMPPNPQQQPLTMRGPGPVAHGPPSHGAPAHGPQSHAGQPPPSPHAPHPNGPPQPVGPPSHGAAPPPSLMPGGSRGPPPPGQQSYPPQGPTQGYPQPQQGSPQGYPQPQQGSPQGYPQPQQGPPQGFPQQGPPQGFPPQSHSPQILPPQGHPPQGFPPQGHPPQGFPPQNHMHHGFPPQGPLPLQGYAGRGPGFAAPPMMQRPGIPGQPGAYPPGAYPQPGAGRPGMPQTAPARRY
ncbi:uncharacterized protein LAESUDRAFT_756394 [Laetiporus sulphureus 93-53]|uniref:Uncharacterized protein n=1 Tax=Laetiporus sulphureus 93-53 TaxID=1314785 RepID=A0A165FUE0_9APHY|nr:uncharacterized protein LAESUDRAFT_756394 [Laetiporus sulphureus 93-53]KZT09423.1 hypothetical protein LAESUDRAFT_756394 [Laetiporus sulphureus 93-53]